MVCLLFFRLLAFVVKLNGEQEVRKECTSMELKDAQNNWDDHENSEINENDSGTICISSSFEMVLIKGVADYSCIVLHSVRIILLFGSFSKYFQTSNSHATINWLKIFKELI